MADNEVHPPCSCACHGNSCPNNSIAQPPEYSRLGLFNNNNNNSSRTEPRIKCTRRLPNRYVHSEALRKSIIGICPKCLKEVKGKRYFLKEPKHDHPSPLLFYTMERSTELANMDKAIGWYTELKVEKRTSELLWRGASQGKANYLADSTCLEARKKVKAFVKRETKFQKWDFKRHGRS